VDRPYYAPAKLDLASFCIVFGEYVKVKHLLQGVLLRIPVNLGIENTDTRDEAQDLCSIGWFL
jgi:hypothetical protein